MSSFSTHVMWSRLYKFRNTFHWAKKQYSLKFDHLLISMNGRVRYYSNKDLLG